MKGDLNMPNSYFSYNFNAEGGEAVCVFNVYVEQALFNSFVKTHKIIKLFQQQQYITVIYTENVNTARKKINK